MPLQVNAIMTYGGFTVNPDGTITVVLNCLQPGENMQGQYTVVLTAANVSTIQGTAGAAAKLTALDTIVKASLISQYRPTTTIQAALDSIVGRTLTV